jgi:hypothetical protein
MNYDKYGFPIFDDDWEDDKAFPQEVKDKPVEKPEKPKNTGLF